MTDELATTDEKLTPKQRIFINEYLVDFNGTQAAIRAGYEETRAAVQAHENLKIPKIALAVEQAIADRVARLGVTQDWVVARLVDNVEQAMRAVPVLDHDGQPIGDYTYQGPVANKALELLGKHVGMFGSKLEITGDGGGPVVIAHERRLTLSDLYQLAERLNGPQPSAGRQLPAAPPLLPAPPND